MAFAQSPLVTQGNAGLFSQLMDEWTWGCSLNQDTA